MQICIYPSPGLFFILNIFQHIYLPPWYNGLMEEYRWIVVAFSVDHQSRIVYRVETAINSKQNLPAVGWLLAQEEVHNRELGIWYATGRRDVCPAVLFDGRVQCGLEEGTTLPAGEFVQQG